MAALLAAGNVRKRATDSATSAAGATGRRRSGILMYITESGLEWNDGDDPGTADPAPHPELRKGAGVECSPQTADRTFYAVFLPVSGFNKKRT